jgi:hypothetical protein
MKFGLPTPSLRRMIAARTSPKRYLRQSLGLKAPRGWGLADEPAPGRVQSRLQPDDV